MIGLRLFFYVLAVVCLALEAFGINPPWVKLGWLGLAILAFIGAVGLGEGIFFK